MDMHDAACVASSSVLDVDLEASSLRERVVAWRKSCFGEMELLCQEERGADELCAICSEMLSDVGGAIVLPCSCTAAYCTYCWDHSLCVSFRATKVARCPSCRSAIRVDFDAEKGRIIFNRNAQDLADSAMMKRLEEQARPLSVSVLNKNQRTFAAPKVPHKATHVCVQVTGRIGKVKRHSTCYSSLGTAAVWYKLRFHDGEDPQVGWFPASKVVDWQFGLGREVPHLALRCICGSNLKRRGDSDWAGMGWSRMDVVCDVCHAQIPARMGAWTCENSTSKIIHAYGYDVCDACMVSSSRF